MKLQILLYGVLWATATLGVLGQPAATRGRREAALERGASAPLSPKLNSAMGLPSKAVADAQHRENYLLVHPQYTMSYNDEKRTTNWTCWHLNGNSLPRDHHYRRQMFFSPDPALPASFVHVQHNDYGRDGFDRGHMTPAADRSLTDDDNQAVFYTTNIIPQAPNNNQYGWERFERHCRDLALEGHELFIACGPFGQGGEGAKGLRQTMGGSRIVVPAKTWKVVLVLPAGKVRPHNVAKSTRTLAVIMPNDQTVGENWTKYQVSVADVERLTGYNFFPEVDPEIAAAIKNRLPVRSPEPGPQKPFKRGFGK